MTISCFNISPTQSVKYPFEQFSIQAAFRAHPFIAFKCPMAKGCRICEKPIFINALLRTPTRSAPRAYPTTPPTNVFPVLIFSSRRQIPTGYVALLAHRSLNFPHPLIHSLLNPIANQNANAKIANMKQSPQVIWIPQSSP